MSDILQETLTDVCVEKVKWLIMTLKNLFFHKRLSEFDAENLLVLPKWRH